MERFLLILLLLCSLSAQAQYRITRTKVAGWALCAVGGIADGLCEGYEFDQRRSFERKYNVSKTGYFGSESWRSVYLNGDPEQGFKSPLHRNMGAFDFYHHADDLRKVGYLSGGVVIGTQHRKNTKKWHTVADFAIGFAVSSLTKSVAMRWIRN